MGERATRRVALLGSTGSIGRQTVDVLAAHPDAFSVVALAAGSDVAGLSEQARRFRPRVVALADDSTRAGLDLPSDTQGGRWRGRAGGAGHARRRRSRHRRHGRRRQPAPGPRRAPGGQGRRHGQQGDAGRRRPPRHAAGARSGGRRRRPEPRRSVCQSAGLATTDRFGALGDLAVPRRRIDGRRGGACPDRLGRPIPRCGRRDDGSRDPGTGASPPDLDDGRQDHDRLGDACQQGPGGHRGTLAVRCRLRRDRGGHPSAERRPLRRPVRGWFPESPAGHPGYETSHPVRPDLPRPPAVTGRAARPDRRGLARVPGAGRDPLPGAPDRSRGRSVGSAGIGRADRRG